MEAFKLCVLETPYAGYVKDNVEYAQKCMHDMLLRHEAPYASHLLYTQPNVLDDLIPEERELGIYAGFAFKHMEGVHTVFYVDKGMSNGMNLALGYCKEFSMSYEIRNLGEIMTKVKIIDPSFMDETGVVEYVCTDNQHPVAKIKLDSTGDSVMMFLNEFETVEEEK